MLRLAEIKQIRWLEHAGKLSQSPAAANAFLGSSWFFRFEELCSSALRT
jgi:hypothetical protein